MRFARTVFFVAGIYGVLVLTPLFFMEVTIGRLTPPAASHPEPFYGFLGVGLAWQYLLFLLSTHPIRYRPMMLPSIVEKIVYGTALVILHEQGRLSIPTVAIGLSDWIFAALFVVAYFRTMPARTSA